MIATSFGLLSPAMAVKLNKLGITNLPIWFAPASGSIGSSFILP